MSSTRHRDQSPVISQVTDLTGKPCRAFMAALRPCPSKRDFVLTSALLVRIAKEPGPSLRSRVLGLKHERVVAKPAAEPALQKYVPYSTTAALARCSQWSMGKAIRYAIAPASLHLVLDTPGVRVSNSQYSLFLRKVWRGKNAFRKLNLANPGRVPIGP